MVRAGDLSKASLSGKIVYAQERCKFKSNALGQIARCGFKSRREHHIPIERN